MLAAKCGPMHIRNHQNIPDDEFLEILKKVCGDSGLKNDEKMKNETDAPEKSADAKKELPKVLLEMKKIISLNTDESSKWSGSLTFLKKYV